MDLFLTFSMRFEGVLCMLGVLNRSSRCILVLGNMQYASVNLWCCLRAPRLVGASVQLHFGTLWSLQYTGKLSHAGMLRLWVLQLQWQAVSRSLPERCKSHDLGTAVLTALTLM